MDGDTADTRPGSTTWFGDTGLWFVPTGEILPAGKWSISGYRANFDREQGLTDISHFIGTFGVGIGDRVEVFGSVRADTRIKRVARPLFNPSDPNNGGVLNEYPFVTNFWNDDGLGDLIVGAKFNIASEHREQPAALAIRAAIKVPTGDEDLGRSTGEPDVMVDFIVSKNIQERVELSGFGGFLARGEPNGITLGNSIPVGPRRRVPDRRTGQAVHRAARRGAAQGRRGADDVAGRNRRHPIGSDVGDQHACRLHTRPDVADGAAGRSSARA